MKQRKDAWAWLKKSDAAAAAGYSVRHFSDSIQPRLDSNAVRGKSGAMRFDIRAVIAAVKAYVAEQNRPERDVEDPLDVDTPTGKDPVLDEYRREATLKLQLANAETRRELISRADLLTALARAFSAAGACGRKLVMKYGNEAGKLWNEGLEAMESAAKGALSGGVNEDERERAGPPAVQPGEGQADPVDRAVRRGRDRSHVRPARRAQVQDRPPSGGKADLR